MKIFGFLFVLPALGLLTISANAADVREREPDPEKSTGKAYEWKAADGLAYQYFIPRNYDTAKGANLTFILHGSNLARGWGFANHKPGDFRPDDIVVCPDGTTPNGNGGFNFMGEAKDAERLNALHKELGMLFKINATYLYGHSQGSFFALHYAGDYPDQVHGIVAHASGVWTWTKRPEAAKHQAIVFMHGTADPVVPFSQSKGGVSAYQNAKFPNVRLRALEGWNHWPAEHNGPIPHTSQQLAWVEGMTTTDFARVGVSYATLSRPKEKSLHDFAGLYLLSKRITEFENAPDRAKQAAAASMKKVDDLAKQHIAAMKAPAANEAPVFQGDSWVGYLPVFLRQFEGVHAADAYLETWKPTMDKQLEAVKTHFANYRAAVQTGNDGAAFEAGVAAIRDGYLMSGCTDLTFLKKLETWADDRSLEIDKVVKKEGKKIVEDFRKALQSGAKDFQTTNKKASL